MNEPISHTTVHTFTVEHYANPFLICTVCRKSVVGYIHSPEHAENWKNFPCHHLGITSSCPSWSPVDGCRCQEHLGSVEHSAPRIRKNIFYKEGP
jgi:hypothetical protein